MIAMRATTELCLVLLLGLAACEDGSDGAAGAPEEPGGGTDDDLVRGEDLPGLDLTLIAVTGATGPGGNFRPGDAVTVRFTLEKHSGAAWSLDEMAFGRAHLAGPTSNYQRVLPEVDDVREHAVFLGGTQWRYTFPAQLPATYAAPYNDSPSFDADDGEWTGQPLIEGTYTVALSFGWEFTLDGEPGFVDVGEASASLLVGGSAVLAPRAVTSIENCNECHGDLRYHDDERRELVQCFMCHTSGAEDLNDPLVGGGTPGVSIESRVLFHKLHSGRHLPSVLGIGVDAGGDLDYAAAPRPLQYASSAGELVDFSWVGFSAFPNRLQPRDKNFGWSSLTADAQQAEDAVRSGVISCVLCHGDPDGVGPIEPPADGDLVYASSTRRACGACHDDVDWDLPYRTNQQEMPPQTDDGTCVICHDDSFAPLGIRGGHLHPLDDSFWNPGRNLALLAIADTGGDDDGSFDAGEALEVTFTLTHDTGADVAASELDALRVVFAGPTTGQQVLLEAELPLAALTGPQPFTIALQEPARLEFVGSSTALGSEVFTTARAPHLNVAGAVTTVEVVVGAGAASTLSAAVDGPSVFVDLADASGFARDDVVVIDPGGANEGYARVQQVEANRLWFGAPGSAATYRGGVDSNLAAGLTVQVVSLATLTEGVDYALDPATGRVVELIEFGAGSAVLASYTAPYELPVAYPAAHHDSDLVGEVEGEWRGLPLVSGTYAVTLWAEDSFNISFAGETSHFESGSTAARMELGVLDPGEVLPYASLPLPARCNDCHQDIGYHGGRYRGFESCLACHGGSGAEDRPTWVSPDAPRTDAQRIDLRWLLHGLHRGRDLDDPAAFVVVGEGSDPYPGDFTARTYAGVRFPDLPGGSANCARCHGNAAAWEAPPDRGHPQNQSSPQRAWRDACAACHDATAARAHIDSHTAPSGAESCAICHGKGEEWSISRTHRGY